MFYYKKTINIDKLSLSLPVPLFGIIALALIFL